MSQTSASVPHGFLGVDKPPEMTSFRVTGAVRRALGLKRAGHTGTLDPLATGVLVVALNEATRTLQFIPPSSKGYRVIVALGFASNTGDLEGEITGAPLERQPALDRFGAVLASFVGRQAQVPPGFSAIRVAGKKSYHLARAGKEVPLAPRDIEIFSFQDIQFLPGEVDLSFPERLQIPEGCRRDLFGFRVDCGKGTYIRSLVRDLGERLGTPALMVCLRRIESDTLTIGDCCPLETIRAADSPLSLRQFIPLREFFRSRIPFFAVPPEWRKAAQNGAPLPLEVFPRTVGPMALDLFPEPHLAFYEAGENSLLAGKVCHL